MDGLVDVSSLAELEGLMGHQLAALAYLPSSVNATAILLQRFSQAVLPKEPPASRPLLVLVSVLSALSAICLAAAFYLRWRRNTLWVVRLVQARSHLYVMWHYSMSWSAGLIILLLALQGYIWSCWKVAGAEATADLLEWVTIPWCAGISQVAIACWSLSVTYLLHLKTYTASTRRWPWYTSARAVNPFCFFLTFVDFVVIVPCAVQASKHYRAVFRYAAQLEGTVGGWTGEVSPELLQEVAPVFWQMLQAYNSAAKWFQITTLLCAAFAVTLEALFLVVSILYLLALRKSLRELSSRLGRGVDAFRSTLKGLIRISAAFALLMTLLSCNAVWVGVLAKQVLIDASTRMLAAVLPIACVVAGALPSAILVLYQAYTTYPSFPSSSSATSAPSSPKNSAFALGLSRPSPVKSLSPIGSPPSSAGSGAGRKRGMPRRSHSISNAARKDL
ncbi:hypothetical protein JCM10213v2_007451 [Rhodosporidiobolus nylandii]